VRGLSRFSQQLAIWICVGLATAAFSQTAPVQNSHEFDRVFSVTLKDPVRLDVDLGDGDLQVGYARDGQVSVAIVAQGPDAANIERDLLARSLNIRQDGNHLELRRSSDSTLLARKIKLTYRLDVPYRTELHSFLQHGKQTIIGIMGPVEAKTKQGDVKVSYVSKEVDARTDAGNVDLQVIGGRIEAAAGVGDISCARAPLGISAQTNDGQISLIVVGSSIATVKTGNGGIDAQGVRGTLVATTAAGDVHVKAVPHDDWQLAASSGNVRIEFPPQAGVDLDASSISGEVTINRDDIDKSSSDVHHLQQKVNGGGKRIVAHTESGKVVIS
jgi:DUF4097 and DUF4098 domain-containing protein YvlB